MAADNYNLNLCMKEYSPNEVSCYYYRKSMCLSTKSCIHQQSVNIKHTKQYAKKTQWSLLPFRELEDVARAFMSGNDKEGREPNDWQTKQTRQACIDAAMRHIINYQIKGRYDEDGIKHISQAIARLLMVDYFDNQED